MEGIVLKPNMILSGADSGLKNEPAIVSAKTLECLNNNVPKEVPGIAFLSGGQSELAATTNLNEINKINDTKLIFTAKSISSIDISIIITFFLFKNIPTTPIEKIIAARDR